MAKRDIDIHIRAHDETRAGFAQAAGGAQQFQRDVAASGQAATGLAAQAQMRLAHVAEVALKIGGTIAALRAASGLVGVTVALARKDFDGAVEMMKRLPLGVGAFLSDIEVVHELITGVRADRERFMESLAVNDAVMKSWERFQAIVATTKREIAESRMGPARLGESRLGAERAQRLAATEGLSGDQARIARKQINESYWAKIDAAAASRTERLQDELIRARIAGISDDHERGAALLDLEYRQRLRGLLSESERGLAEQIYKQRLANLPGPQTATAQAAAQGGVPLYAARFLTGPSGTGPDAKTARATEQLVKRAGRAEELDTERNGLLARIVDGEVVRITIVRANR